jgi:tetratricopeptide (TPR) repeat protein
MDSRPPVIRLVGIGLIAVALLLAVYVVIAYLGYQSGQELAVTRIELTRSAGIAVQLDRARAELDDRNFRLALRRLEWILERDPQNEQALQLQSEAQGALQTPTPGAATATPELVATEQAGAGTGAAPASVAEAARGLQRLVRLVEQEAWDEAISGLLSFQNRFPDYERRRTDELLQQAYIGRGLAELYGAQVELGMYYLAQAEALGALPQDVLDQRLWAELYLNGIAYYGVNWEVSLFYYRQLCPAAPFYQDACDTLYDILMTVGDASAGQGEWCPAEPYYQEALTVRDDNTASQKLRQARDGCRNATPTPTSPVTDTIPFTGTLPGDGVITGTAPIEPEP